eukprot:scaffold116604_cov16-Prasinocladus_malaysianus.AAC.2
MRQATERLAVSGLTVAQEAEHQLTSNAISASMRRAMDRKGDCRTFCFFALEAATFHRHGQI